MARSPKIKYRDIVDRLDIDAFEEAIGWEPRDHKDGNDIGICPDPWGMHNQNLTNKFAIHRTKKVYNCFKCGGGSLLSLAMALNSIGEQQAIDWLSQFADAEKGDDDFEQEMEALLTQDERRRDPILPWFNEKVIEPWQETSCSWFTERGISESVRVEHKLGFDPEHSRLSSKGNYQGPAVILPHYWGGRLVGWQERWLSTDRPKWIPKYTNTSDFPRNWTIFNYERVYFADRPIVVCESVATVLFLASLNLPAVATFGSNVTEPQLIALRHCQQGVILAPDNDKAGEMFAQTLSGYLENFIDVKVAPVVDGEGSDLGDLVVEPDLIPKVLEAAEYLMPNG